MHRVPLAGLRLVQHPPEPPELLFREEPLALAFAFFATARQGLFI